VFINNVTYFKKKLRKKKKEIDREISNIQISYAQDHVEILQTTSMNVVYNAHGKLWKYQYLANYRVLKLFLLLYYINWRD